MPEVPGPAVPEPGREEWIARLRERARQDAEELVPRPAFGIYGLLTPDLRPAALAEAQQVNGVWTQIGLAYGDPVEPAGPRISVASVLTGPVPRPGPGPGPGPGAGRRDRELELEWSLRLLLDQERNRIADHAGIDEEEPASPPGFSGTDLIVDRRAVSSVLCRHGNLWAARLTIADVIVLLVGRGVDPGSVRLGAVRDLAPYVRNRGEVIGRLAERRRQRLEPGPGLPPAEGVAAYRALIKLELGFRARRAEAFRAGRAPRHQADDGAITHTMWQLAVREQGRISGCDGRQAGETVTLVVNHLGQLAEQAPWFSADPELRDAAIDQTLRHCVLGEDVPSAKAQLAWARYWSHHVGSLGADPAEFLRARQTRQALESGWLEAWSAWTQQD